MALQTVDAPAFEKALGDGKHGFQVMDATGDTKTIWNPDSEEEVDAAREQFDALTKKGYRAFHVKKGGDKGELMTKFEATAAKMIFVPQVAGG